MIKSCLPYKYLFVGNGNPLIFVFHAIFLTFGGMNKPQKKRPKKYAEKVKTDKSFMELVKIAVNYKPKKTDTKTP